MFAACLWPTFRENINISGREMERRAISPRQLSCLSAFCKHLAKALMQRLVAVVICAFSWRKQPLNSFANERRECLMLLKFLHVAKRHLTSGVVCCRRRLAVSSQLTGMHAHVSVVVRPAFCISVDAGVRGLVRLVYGRRRRCWWRLVRSGPVRDRANLADVATCGHLPSASPAVGFACCKLQAGCQACRLFLGGRHINDQPLMTCPNQVRRLLFVSLILD